MSFDVRNINLNDVKHNLIACTSELSLWLGRNVTPICAKLVPTNPIVTVAFFALSALGAVLSLYFYQKVKTEINDLKDGMISREKEHDVAVTRTVEETKRKYKERINKLNSQISHYVSDQKNDALSIEQFRKTIADLKTNHQAELKLAQEKFHEVQTQLIEANINANLLNSEITQLKKAIEEQKNELKTTLEDKENEFHKLIKEQAAAYEKKIPQQSEEEKANIADLEAEIENKETLLTNLLESYDALYKKFELLTRPPVENAKEVIHDILDCADIRPKHKARIEKETKIQLQYQTLPKIQKFIDSLTKLNEKIKEDEYGFVKFRIDLNDWSAAEISDENSLNNLAASTFNITESVVDLTGSVIDSGLSRSVLEGRKEVNSDEVTRLIDYFKNLEKLIEKTIPLKPEVAETAQGRLQDKLIMTFHNFGK